MVSAVTNPRLELSATKIYAHISFPNLGRNFLFTLTPDLHLNLDHTTALQSCLGQSSPTSRHSNYPQMLTMLHCCRPWIETYIWLKGALPDLSGGWKFKIPHISFNYIMLHCKKDLDRTQRARGMAYISPTDTYLLALTIIGSVVLFGAGNMAYIDALFFASGCATQSGLNTYVATRYRGFL